VTSAIGLGLSLKTIAAGFAMKGAGIAGAAPSLGLSLSLSAAGAVTMGAGITGAGIYGSRLKDSFNKAMDSLGEPSGGGGSTANPKDIRYTQDSISKDFKNNKGSIKSLIDKLKKGKISPDDLPNIRVVEKNGKVYSLDNRRLHAYKEAGVNKINVTEVKLTNRDIAKEFYRKTRKGQLNDGFNIRVRGE